MDSISEKIKNYESAYDQKIISGIPIIVRVDARSFERITRKLARPFDPFITDILNNTMLDTIADIDGAVFGYQYNDEISFIINSDNQYWLKNSVQKIAAITASKVSINFLKNVLYHETPPKLEDDVIFDATVFALPNIKEVINYLSLKQSDCKRNAVLKASLYELKKIYGKEEAEKILTGKKSKEKIELLSSECEIDFYIYYPASFINGVGAYKVPHLIKSVDSEPTVKKRWILDTDLPRFSTDLNFISNILESGHDVFRSDRDFDD